MGEDCGCEGCDQGGGGSQAGFVGFAEGDAEVVEAVVGVWGEVGGGRVVVVVGEDGYGGWGDDGVAGDGGDIAEGVAEGGLHEGVVVDLEVCISGLEVSMDANDMVEVVASCSEF